MDGRRAFRVQPREIVCLFVCLFFPCSCLSAARVRRRGGGGGGAVSSLSQCGFWFEERVLRQISAALVILLQLLLWNGIFFFLLSVRYFLFPFSSFVFLR